MNFAGPDLLNAGKFIVFKNANTTTKCFFKWAFKLFF